MPKKQKTTTRITVDLKPHLYARLTQLEELAQADSKADVIRDALQVYEFIVNKMAKGAIIQTVEDGKSQEIVLLGPKLPP